ncbi:MAG: PHP domain-containing protein [PVC group bacterium]|nr:PHP domain-containing protein [PVC group bacterium]
MNQKNKFIDLHVHTNFSDGTFTPQETVAYALKRKMAAIAITDHDCVDAIPHCINTAQGENIEIVPGIELAAEIGDREIHVLGLFIEWNAPWFLEKLKQIREARFVRMQKMIQKLSDVGIDISEKEVLALSGSSGSIGRLHLARALINKGQIRSFREVFDKYIGNGKPCYVKRLSISPEEVIDMIKKLKGVPILAHPAVTNSDKMIPELVQAGLMGLEVHHSDQNNTATKRYAKIAREYGLVVSGGSDCHGMGKGYPLLGTLNIPYEVLENIKKARDAEYNIADSV